MPFRYFITIFNFTVILFSFHIQSINAEIFYKWADKDGVIQYSNTPPKGYEENDPHVEIIEGTPQLSKKGAFTLIERKTDEKLLQFIPDAIWSDKFKKLNKAYPELPSDNAHAREKLSKIIADETVFLEVTIKNYHQYLIDYDRRKRQHETEVAKNKEKINLKIWRTTPLESNEEFIQTKKSFEQKIKYRKLLLQWAEQKKQGIELLIKQ